MFLITTMIWMQKCILTKSVKCIGADTTLDTRKKIWTFTGFTTRTQNELD